MIKARGYDRAWRQTEPDGERARPPPESPHHTRLPKNNLAGFESLPGKNTGLVNSRSLPVPRLPSSLICTALSFVWNRSLTES